MKTHNTKQMYYFTNPALLGLIALALLYQTQVLGFPERESRVRTTAYTHSESDHVQYGRKTAKGTKLQFSPEYHSAAADWSRFPVGTEFRIKGINRHFVIDDYGSALVGTGTIDIYFPTRSKMNRWGVQHVDIVITKYGDFEQSKEILQPRLHYSHCKTMFQAIEKKIEAGSDKPVPVPPVPDFEHEIDEKLMAAASIPKDQWSDPAPKIEPDPLTTDPGDKQPQVLLAEIDTPSEVVEPPLPPESEWQGPPILTTLVVGSTGILPEKRRFKPIEAQFLPADSEFSSLGVPENRQEPQTKPSRNELWERKKRDFRPL